MKTLKVLLQEVVSGIKAWVNSNFAQESNTVHKTGNETVNGSKEFTGYLQVKNRIAYQDTSVIDKTGSDVYRAVDTYAHQGGDGSYWGGLKQIWFADGQSALQLAVANHKLNGSTWSQGFWAVNLSASKDFYSVNFAPSNNNAINLGAANYQWYNVYAKNYFYNGTQWGLDQANTWTNEQTYSTGFYGQMIWLKNTDLDLSVNGNTGLSGTYQQIIKWVDKNKTAYSIVQSWTNSSENVLVLRSYYRTDADTLRDSSIRNQCTATAKRWYPETDADTDLGSANHRWKSFNDVNPGALSLPVGVVSTSIQIDTTDWDLTGQNQNNVLLNNTPGYLWVSVPNVSGNYIYARRYQAGGNMQDCRLATGDGYPAIFLIFPLTEGNALVKVKSDTVSARFYPCKGNV